MSDERMREAAELVDAIFALGETIKDHEANIALLRKDSERKEERLRLLVEGTGLTEVAGSLARATFTTESVPRVFDWQSLYEFIQQTASFDLLHKRIGVKAWQERVNAGMYVPGVEQVVIPKTNIKAKRR